MVTQGRSELGLTTTKWLLLQPELGRGLAAVMVLPGFLLYCKSPFTHRHNRQSFLLPCIAHPCSLNVAAYSAASLDWRNTSGRHHRSIAKIYRSHRDAGAIKELRDSCGGVPWYEPSGEDIWEWPVIPELVGYDFYPLDGT